MRRARTSRSTSGTTASTYGWKERSSTRRSFWKRSEPAGQKPRPWGVSVLALLTAAALIAIACGSSDASNATSTATQPPTATWTPAPTTTATAAPSPTSTPGAAATDRTDCSAIRGTAYRSEAERQFFLTNCTGQIAAPQPTAIPATGDRTDCNAIRGTAYRSEGERQFFLANCVTNPGPPPVAVAPLITPPGGATAIGDSVMLGAAPQLQAAIGGLYLDATVSRQASMGAAALQPRAGALGSVVIIHLGNNGTFTPQEFDSIMALLGGVPRVLFVNLNLPRAWAAPNNQMLAANVGRYANARLVDWLGVSSGHPEYFAGDQVHLTQAGAAAYTAMIVYAAA